MAKLITTGIKGLFTAFKKANKEYDQALKAFHKQNPGAKTGDKALQKKYDDAFKARAKYDEAKIKRDLDQKLENPSRAEAKLYRDKNLAKKREIAKSKERRSIAKNKPGAKKLRKKVRAGAAITGGAATAGALALRKEKPQKKNAGGMVTKWQRKWS